MNRDTFNQIRLLRAPSTLTLDVPRDGAFSHLSGQPVPGFHHPHKNFFFLSSLNLLSFGLKPLVMVHHIQRQTSNILSGEELLF